PRASLSVFVDLIVWIRDEFEVSTLFQFLRRAALAPLAAAGVWVGAQWSRRGSPGWSRQEALCLLFAACICIQPLLTGPRVTGAAVIRLVTLALVPLLLAVSLRLRSTGPLDHASVWRMAALELLLVAGSLHPTFTFLEGSAKQPFTLPYSSVALG